MVNYCVCAGCTNSNQTGHRVHFFPCKKRNGAVFRAWVRFVKTKRRDFDSSAVSQNAVVCSAHFKEEDYVEGDLMQFRMGFRTQNRVRLLAGAVPSIHIGVSAQTAASGASAGAKAHGPRHSAQRKRELNTSKSEQTSTAYVPRIRHMGCQTDRVHPACAAARRTSVGTQSPCIRFLMSTGTQLSYGILKQHVRSKGTQVTIPCKSVSTETTQRDAELQSSSTPVRGVRPAKRPRLELPEADEEEEDEEDCTYEPAASVTQPSAVSGRESTSYSEPKYIVFESCLRELFQTCPACRQDCDVRRQRLGTFVSFSQQCPNCRYNRKWQSQPIRGSTPLGNLHMSAAVYFTGGSFVRAEKIFKAMNVQMFQSDTYSRHARMFLEPAIHHKWKKDQQALMEQLQQKGRVGFAGGPSAKFGSYTLMHQESSKVIDIQLIQSSEAGGSPRVEKEALRRGLDVLEANHVDVDYIVTDRNTGVETFLKDRNVTQYYDICHFEKGLSKKLGKVTKNKECLLVAKWLQSIKNHMYWTATSSTSGAEKVAKWTSLINHIQDVHTHNNPMFPKCAHPHRVSRDRGKWFQPGSVALSEVEKLLLNERVLRDVEKLSPLHRTTSLDAFHSVVTGFMSKNAVFPFTSRICRLYLAAMQFNENAEREQHATSESTDVSEITSAMGACRAAPGRTEQTFNYVTDLMRLLFEEVFLDPTSYTEQLRQIPGPVHTL